MVIDLAEPCKKTVSDLPFSERLDPVSRILRLEGLEGRCGGIFDVEVAVSLAVADFVVGC